MAVRGRCAVTEYAEQVLSGRVAACRWVRLACERHLRDLEMGRGRGLWFDEEEAERVFRFFALLPHVKGEWARDGSTIRLEPWQRFILGSIFGWKREDGLRRFRTAYIEVPRKNAKSTLAAGVGLWLAFFDGEPGAEVYAAATKRDQAKIVWGDARQMVLKTPGLRARIRAFVSNLHSAQTASKFEPLGADADSLDGLNIHGAIVDELHAHRTRALWDVLVTATGARRQALIFAITTAGWDRTSICWEQHDYVSKVLEGIVPDDTVFGYIATIDEGDDWTDPAAWAKANPNLGISVKMDDLERQCAQARHMPAAQNAFKRLRLNVWTEASERWIDTTVWDQGAVSVRVAEGASCYAGLDLSSTTDLSAFVLLFGPDAEGTYDVLPYFWMPGENIRQRVERDCVPYDLWVRQGYIEATPGNVIDYDVIRARINDLGRCYRIREIAVDRWNATQITMQLQGDGFEMVPMGQGFASMSAPSKEFERLVLEGKIRHGGHPVLRWMVSNVSVVQDAAGNIKPAKDKSTGRIDGVVALIMALDRAVRNQGGSVYNERGLIVL